MGNLVSLEYQFVLRLEILLVQKLPLAIQLLHLFPVPEVDLLQIPLVQVQENFVYHLLLVVLVVQLFLLLLDLMDLINHLLLFVFAFHHVMLFLLTDKIFSQLVPNIRVDSGFLSILIVKKGFGSMAK